MNDQKDVIWDDKKCLEHFEISYDEIQNGGYSTVRNRPEMHERYALERYGLGKHKKFRAIIDYDSEFGVFIVRYEFKD